MKKYTLLAVFLAAFIPTISFAKLPGIDLGIKVGSNFSKLSGDTWDNGYKAGFLGGAFVGVRAAKFGVQVEAFFSQTNYTVDGHNFYDLYSGFYNNANDSAKKGSFRVSYLNIPVLLQIRLVPMLWLQIGPQYSGVVSVKDVDGLVDNAKSLFKSGSVSGVAGLELKLPFHLNVGARYVIGLSNLNASSSSISGTWQDRTLEVHLGYTFL